MPLRRNRKTATPAPFEMLSQLRDAQAVHADKVQAATDELLGTHESLLSQAQDRQQTINEQLALLEGERKALGEVVVTAATTKPVVQVKRAV